jgi:hypothetical protein
MTQAKKITWTNPTPAIARNLDVGFAPDEVTIVDLTNGGSWYWNSAFTDGTVLDVDAGTIAGANGVTPVSQSASYGPAISAFTNANPGVITASGIATFGIAAGDTIKVVGVADDLTATTLNQQYTVASVTATAITTATNTAGYSVYVSGGYVVRVSDSAGVPVAQENKAIEGLLLGTSAVGANAASMVAIVKSDNCVV